MWSVHAPLRAFWRRDRMDDELAEEIGTHLELRRQALIEHRAGRRGRGGRGAPAVRERHGRARAIARSVGQPAPHRLRQDLTFGVRMIGADARAERGRGADRRARRRHQLRDLRLRHQPAPRARSSRTPTRWSGSTTAGRCSVRPIRTTWTTAIEPRAFTDLAAFAVDQGRGRDRAAQAGADPARCWRPATTSPRCRCERPSAARSDPRTICPPLGTATAVVSDGFWAPPVQSRSRDPRADHRAELQAVHHRRRAAGGVQRRANAGQQPVSSRHLAAVVDAAAARGLATPGWWSARPGGDCRPSDGCATASRWLRRGRRSRAVAAAMDREYPEKRHPRAPWVARVTDFDPPLPADRRRHRDAVLLATAAMLVLLIAGANVGRPADRACVGAAPRGRGAAGARAPGARESSGSSWSKARCWSLIGTLIGWLVASWGIQAALSSGASETLAWSFTPNVWTSSSRSC